MDRRSFIGMAGAAGAVALAGNAAGAEGQRMYFELRRYSVDSEAQKAALAAFLRDAAVPALNRLGIAPVGIFEDEKELSPVHLLLPHSTAESFATLTERLLADAEFLTAGKGVLDAPASAPAYARVESSLLRAFSGMPGIETPVTTPGRIVQLRIYESPSAKTGQKKIEMFNVKEIEIFRKVGLAPVFFGECIAGARMPNLTYMLAFDSVEEKDAAWKRFVADPEWLELKAIPDYEDKKILSGITNLILKPLAGSQV